MANNENLNGHGFHERTAREQREIAIAGGKASGEARRRKAAMRDTMNRLLTMKAEVEGLSDILRADGGESTYEEIITMAMIEKAMRGDVKAFMAIKDVLGQTSKSETDLEEQKIRMEQLKADTERMRRNASSEMDDGVEVVNDAPKEAGQDIGDSDTEIPTDF
jgi:hypothetical protein|nr:MAG TPA: hypothetical protein [Caudoviricetes sp.]